MRSNRALFHISLEPRASGAPVRKTGEEPRSPKVHRSEHIPEHRSRRAARAEARRSGRSSDGVSDGQCGQGRHTSRHPWTLSVGVVFAILPGCAASFSTFNIVDFRDAANANRYRETFNEGFYDLDDQGNLRLVLRRNRPAKTADETDIVQVISIQSVWRSIPGETVADKNQINAKVCYSILGGGQGSTFEGAGSVFYKRKRLGDAITGTLDRAVLRPGRALRDGKALFLRAELSGRFRAVRDPRQVVRIINEVERLFGPRSTHSTAS